MDRSEKRAIASPPEKQTLVM